MLEFIEEEDYDRTVLIGRPRLALEDFKCQNITCNKTNQFKKLNDEKYVCECGYITYVDKHTIKESIKPKIICTSKKGCIYGKTKMDMKCLKCELIGEKYNGLD